MNKTACIFDMDGTLVDSMGYWERLAGEFLGSKGVTGDLEPVLEQIRAMTMLESAAQFKTSFGLEGSPEVLAEEMNTMMDEHYRRDIPLKPGVAEYLTALSERGVTLSVATATAEPLARTCLERLGVADQFAFILSCDAVGAGKDRPDVFYEAARRLKKAPEDIAVFEDAFHAAHTAKNCGFYVVGVYDDQAAGRWDALTALTDETIRDWREAVRRI